MHIGIDPGIHGGLAALSDVAGVAPISVIPMPIYKVDGKPQMNTRAIVQWVLDNYAKDDTHIWLEKCPKHSQSKAAMRSMGIFYGRLIGIFEARFPHMILHRVPAGNEIVGWQRQMLGRVDSATSKAKALELARSIWPSQVWRSNRNEVVFDGEVDASLIAEWGRRKTEGT